MPQTDAALVAIVHRTADALSMAGVPARPYGTSALPGLGHVPHADLVMSGARASGPVSRTESSVSGLTSAPRGDCKQVAFCPANQGGELNALLLDRAQ